MAASTSSGGEGGTDTGTDAPPTDPCATPTNPPDPKCLDDSTTLFVSPTGSDTNPGTKAAPLQTVNAAVNAATNDKKRVYVCEGTYAENVKIGKTLALIGGINCAWNAKGTRAKIIPAKGIAVTIAKAATVSITELSIAANADSQVKSDSAIAVFVSESQSVLLKSVDVTAGPGTDGVNGASGDDTPNYSGGIATAGNSTADGTGATAPTCGTCTDATFSAAGKGASLAGVPDPGSASPAVGGDNAGGNMGATCFAGNPGAPGLASAQAAGATSPGSLSADGWKGGVAAAKGGNGKPGQGGGGGGFQAGIGGGSGGCGGCGGSGGTPGGNGGSSFAVLAFNSVVVVEDSSLKSAKGGAGGTGGKGQDGQFRGNNGGGACPGGLGGHGAGGAGGGGGAGGHSAPVGFIGDKPTTTRSTLAPGEPGAVGPGGSAGLGPGNAAPPGGEGSKGTARDLLAL